MVDAIRKKYPSIFGWVVTKCTDEMACEIAFLDRKGFGRFHPLGWNSKKSKVFNFQATN